MPPNITRALRAFPTDQPRLTREPETAPLKKFPRSAAMKGIQTATSPLLERDSFGDKVDRKPIRDKKENGISERSGDYGAPGLREFEKVSPTWPDFLLRLSVLGVRKDHAKLRIADAWMLLRLVIKPTPGDEPEESKQAGHDECRPRAPTEINPKNNKGCNGTADR